MRKEYTGNNTEQGKNASAKAVKKQITININEDTIGYFKDLAEQLGIPYQTLINLYLGDCAKNKRKLQMSWK